MLSACEEAAVSCHDAQKLMGNATNCMESSSCPQEKQETAWSSTAEADEGADDFGPARTVSHALSSLRALAPSDGEDDDYMCSQLLNRGTPRIEKALAMPSVKLAAVLARKMSSLSNVDVMNWASQEGLVRTETVSFFPLRRNEHHVVTVCIVEPAGVTNLQKQSLELIERYGLTFLPLDNFEWGPPTHDVFVQEKFFDKAAEKLKEAGIAHLLVPMVLFKGQGLLLKYHIPQPELKQGTKNPHSSEKSVWTISITDDKPPEVLKVGMREDRVLLVPWNPSAPDVCIQANDFEGDWLTTKNADFHCCHFVCS